MTSFANELTDIKTTALEDPSDLASAVLAGDRKAIGQYVRSCVKQLGRETAQAILTLPKQEYLATLQEDYEAYCARRGNRTFCDVIEFAAGSGEGVDLTINQVEYIDWVSAALTAWVPFQAQTCGFANQTDFRRELYQKYPEIADVCGFLKCPVIDASATDFVVLTSINPFAAKLAAEVIGEIIFRDTRIVPFIFLTTCPVRTRNYLCAKHFVYES